MRSLTFPRSRPYFLNGSLYHCRFAGDMNACVAVMSGFSVPESCLTMASRSVA
jgi:hypothetical protein